MPLIRQPLQKLPHLQAGHCVPPWIHVSFAGARCMSNADCNACSASLMHILWLLVQHFGAPGVLSFNCGLQVEDVISNITRGPPYKSCFGREPPALLGHLEWWWRCAIRGWTFRYFLRLAEAVLLSISWYIQQTRPLVNSNCSTPCSWHWQWHPPSTFCTGRNCV